MYVQYTTKINVMIDITTVSCYPHCNKYHYNNYRGTFMNQNITLAYFSPTGSTKEIAEIFAHATGGEVQHIDFIKNPLNEEKAFSAHDFLVVALPVFAGRIPAVCTEMLRKLKGASTPAVAIAVYGNRDYYGGITKEL